MKTLSKTHRAAVVAVVVAGAVMACLLGAAGAQIPYVGEVITFAGNFCPDTYLSAAGQLLSIPDNEELFVLIGTTFGGDGQSTFALPNLGGATVLGTGQGVGLPAIALGQTGGTTTTVTAQTAIAKSVQVPATQSPSLSLTQCVSLFGEFPSP
jgi:microcystin-dependent protein